MFFFGEYLEDLKKDEKTKYFFDPPKMKPRPDEDVKVFSKRMAAAKDRQKELWKRLGMRWVYSRLLKIGCFNEEGKSHIVSIKRASFRDAATILSMEIAIEQ